MPNEDQPPKTPPACARGAQKGTREQWEKTPHWTIRDRHLLLTAWYWVCLG